MLLIFFVFHGPVYGLEFPCFFLGIGIVDNELVQQVVKIIYNLISSGKIT